MPQLSVILPAFNAAATVTEAVGSIVAQTVTDWELLAIDDGSTDATGAILNAHAARDARIHVISQRHRGVCAAANVGLARARGSYLARMDADDVAHPERLARQLAFLEAHPAVDFASCRVEFGGDAGAQAGFARHVAWLNGVLTPEDHARAQFAEFPLANPTLLGRAAAWRQVGNYTDGPFPEDYHWFLRAMEAGCRFAKVPETLLTWNDPPSRLTRTDARYEVAAFFAVKIPFAARWVARTVDPERPLYGWGAGRVTRQRMRPWHRVGRPLTGWIDVDPHKVGGRVDGRPVLTPAALLQLRPKPFILPAVTAVGARDNIGKWLEANGFAATTDWVAMA